MKNDQKKFFEAPEQASAYKKMTDAVRAGLASGEQQMEPLTAEQVKQLKSRYSHFQDSFDGEYLTNSTLVIDKLHTPKGWFHYMLNLKHTIRDVALSIAAHDGAGVMSLDSVLFGPVTKLSGNENYMHVSQVYHNARTIWVKTDSGSVFSLIPQPNQYDAAGKCEAEAYDGYSCRQGPGFIEYLTERDGLKMSLRIFVPLSLPCEIWTISITNTTDKKRSVQVYPEINFGLDSHPSHYFVGMAVSEVTFDGTHNAIIAKNLDIKNSFPRWGAFISARKPDSFDSCADTYYKFGASIMYPPSVFDESLSNTEAKQPLKGMIGAFQYKVDLGAGKTFSTHCAVSAVNPAKDVNRQVSDVYSFLTDEQIEKELKDVSAAWQSVINTYLVDTPCEPMNRTFNIWGKYQSILCSRFNSPYDVGTRDMFQYLLANCMFEPGYVRLFVPFMLSYQYRDGRIPRQICKFSSLHDLRNFMDCQLWAPDLVEMYIRETGDMALLDKKVGFLENDNVTLSEKGAVSIYDHLVLAVKSAYEGNIGEHGLCKLGYGGWNDALDGLRGNRSESVWLSQLLVYAARKMAVLAQLKKDNKTIEYMNSLIKNISSAINKSGWDTEGYYIFGYDNDGQKVGASVNDEGQKHLNENAWAFISDVIPQQRFEPVISAMDELQTPFGHRLLKPYSKKSSVHVGRIADQAQGHFENGAVYQHGVLFWAAALLKAGYVDQAYESFRRISDDNRLPDISTNPPIYHSNYTAVPNNADYGKEPYYPFTGSHSWRMRFMAEMIGIVPHHSGMKIDPRVPSVWREAVQNGERILSARKVSHRAEHKNIVIELEVYRDDALKGAGKVSVDGKFVTAGHDGITIPYNDHVFVNSGTTAKIVKVAVYL
ncbi:MAG: hypothetical protein AB1454_02375 [Candidatus Auribacterota bacterium]